MTQFLFMTSAESDSNDGHVLLYRDSDVPPFVFCLIQRLIST